jgi:hypothetical protein
MWYLAIFTRNYLAIQFCWLRALRSGSTATRLLRLRVRIFPGVLMSVSFECCVLSGGGFCDGPIRRRGESYRMCICHWVWRSATITICPYQWVGRRDKKEIKKETSKVIYLWRGSVIEKSIATALLKLNMIKPTGAMCYIPMHGSIRPSTWKWRFFSTLYPTLAGICVP